MSITGVNIVPKPNPEKKVRIAAENVTKQISIISIIYSGIIIEKVFQIEIMKKILLLIVSFFYHAPQIHLIMVMGNMIMVILTIIRLT